ncbi:MAG: hypothetical protein K2M54_09180 [Muribaculaceae bacterium]|nr:hypothetical protein [Muribaculaceae bacterium]
MDKQLDQTIAEPAASYSEAEDKNKRAKFNKFALLAILLAVASWVILSFNGQIALGVSIAAFLSSCLGLKASTRTWRNTAITALVASTVLLIVLAAFMFVMYVGLKAI